jgi:histidyl-tRNA synthetase
MGIERLMMVLSAQNAELPKAPTCDLFIATLGENAILKASALCRELRDEGYKVQTDICGRGLKAQMKYADKIGAKFTLVLGDNEAESGKATLKNMSNSAEKEIALAEIVEELGEELRKILFESIAEVF